jgi:hypothetical protein
MTAGMDTVRAAVAGTAQWHEASGVFVRLAALRAALAEHEYLRALLMRVRERGLNAPLDSAIEDALGSAPPRDDTARLDWLDAHWHSAFVAKTERGYLPWRDGTDYVVGLREAIDAARGDGNDD